MSFQRAPLPEQQSRPMTLMVALGLAESGDRSGCVLDFRRVRPYRAAVAADSAGEDLRRRLARHPLFPVGRWEPGDSHGNHAAGRRCDHAGAALGRFPGTDAPYPELADAADGIPVGPDIQPLAGPRNRWRLRIRFFLAAVPELAVALLAVCLFGDRRLMGISYFLGALLVSVSEKAGMAQIGLLICCVVVMAIATLRQATADRERAIALHQQDMRAQRSDRLLQEHERTGRGWFWETDRHGCITYISDTLAQTLDAQPRRDDRPPDHRNHPSGRQAAGRW